MKLSKRIAIGMIAVLPALHGCTTNPVTGQSQFSLLSRADEIAIGEQQYVPSQQSQGGEYTVDPNLNAYISSVGQKLARVSDRPDLPYEFVVLNNDVPNAWALPGGKIAINRGLLYELEDESQLAAVLGHEIVHAAARHGATQQSQSTILGGLGSLIQAVGESYGYGALTQQGVALGASAFTAQYGQGQELEADRYGMDYMGRVGYEPMGAVELQQTFVKLSEGQNTSALQAFFQSHPPSQKRVAANLEKARSMSDGTRNKAAFDRAMAQIRKDKPAYDLHTEALKLAGAKDYQGALAKVEQAIAKQPKEALFWTTKGQLQTELKNEAAAKTSFNKAISLNNEYFAPYLYRGIISVDQKEYAAARSDLLQSNQWLPTAYATYYLGLSNANLGNIVEARQNFTAVQQVGGELGQAATRQLEQLGN
ncbi:M48 family metalloprotease [Sessilibacter sp. MAH4]